MSVIRFGASLASKFKGKKASKLNLPLTQAPQLAHLDAALPPWRALLLGSAHPFQFWGPLPHLLLTRGTRIKVP